MNLDRDWEEFRLEILAEILRRKEDLSIEKWEVGETYTCFKSQFEMNLACAERYLIKWVVPEWRDYPSAESMMFPNVFVSPDQTWDVNRTIPYRLRPFLKSVDREVEAPRWYKEEKKNYVNYMKQVDKNIQLCLAK